MLLSEALAAQGPYGCGLSVPRQGRRWFKGVQRGAAAGGWREGLQQLCGNEGPNNAVRAGMPAWVVKVLLRNIGRVNMRSNAFVLY